MKKIKSILYIILLVVLIAMTIKFHTDINFYKINIEGEDINLTNLTLVSNNNYIYLMNDITIESRDKDKNIRSLYINIKYEDITIFNSYTKLDDLDTYNEKIITINNLIKKKCNLDKNDSIDISFNYMLNGVKKEEHHEIILEKYILDTNANDT